MSVLRNLEAKLEGLVEGAFSRAFRSKVQPAEIARKLAREMEENKTASLSRVYVPNHYVVFLSPGDHDQFGDFADGLRKELSDFLLEHARAEGMSLVSRPQVEFQTDDRLGLGEFGIQARLLQAQPEEQDSQPVEADFGNTMVYSADNVERVLPAAPPGGRALLVSSDKRYPLSGSHVVLGRSRDCDIRVEDPNVSRHHAELSKDQHGRWIISDLGSTNGIGVNGRRVESSELEPGDHVTIGLTSFTFERE